MTPPNDTQNGWSEWKNYVLKSLDRIEENQDKLREDVSALKARAAVWGSVAAFIVTTLVNLAIGAMK